MRKMHPAPQPATAPVASSNTRQQAWLGHAEFTRQMMLLRTGRAMAPPVSKVGKRRLSPRPVYRAMPLVT